MKVTIASKNQNLINQLHVAIKKFESFKEQSIEIVEFNSYLELINESVGNETIIFTDESLINSEEELHFIKILKNKNAAVILIHIYEKYAPFTMEEFVVNAISKFLKFDSNIENSALRSLSVLSQKELTPVQYGY